MSLVFILFLFVGAKLRLLSYNIIHYICVVIVNLRDAPEASVAMVDDERNTFYHHHGCVEAQSLRLVNAYLADKGIDGHQQVLLTVVGTLRVIYAVDDDEAEIARNSVLAERRICAS